MADPNQYLRLQLGEASYLLPSASGFTIEQREHLITNKSPEGNVAAWQSVRSARLPAYCLDGMLRVTRHHDWHRAVFLDAVPHAVGLVVDEVQLLPRSETVVSPFTPLGLPPTRLGHLFSGAWVTGNRIMLVLDPEAFVAYLQSLGDG
ncbi:MAG: chemotaxis protein CheW [Gammaproteobacteria bacterium]|nr:chemotaxis protein CheW [Gammaproteobacteria bacterium]